ncbi:RN166 protein, partial [Polypterus senegalus]|nr:RN166 protein [Polypterus senegalus]
MAMFRSFVSGVQQKQQQTNGATTGDSLESQYSCPICLEVYHKPVSIGNCGHTFCGECLQPCLQVPSPLCPLCRMPFDPKKVEKSSNVEKQLSSYKAPCRGCSKKVCPVCSAMPWGDPSYKSANFLQHLLHRHKFSYDTFVVSERGLVEELINVHTILIYWHLFYFSRFLIETKEPFFSLHFIFSLKCTFHYYPQLTVPLHRICQRKKHGI